MELQVINSENAKSGKCALAEAVFGVDYNESLIHQVVVAYAEDAAQGAMAQQTR